MFSSSKKKNRFRKENNARRSKENMNLDGETKKEAPKYNGRAHGLEVKAEFNH